MSGIAGYVGWNNISARGDVVQEMLGPMRRDPLFSPKIVSFPDFGLELGWLSGPEPVGDCVSAWNEQQDVFLLFRGEHFSCDEPARASVNGEEADNISTAAHVLRLYEQSGLGVFTKLNGCFSGVLVNRRENSVLLFNDRYGLGRIYYHQTSDGVYFSSEAKALLKVLPSLRQLDARSLGEFLSCNCVLQDRTIFRGVSVLPAGSVWTFRRNAAVEKRRYFHPSAWEDQPRLSPRDYHESLRRVFPNILKRYLQHPVGVGMSLTGGLDGRLVMAWSELEPWKMPCYTFASSFGETADVRIAREVASVCTQPYTELTVGDEFLSQFPDLAQETVLASDGAMDVSAAAELYVNRLAREIKPVRLTGNYGSEILRGNVAFRPRKIFEPLFDRDLARVVQWAANTYVEESCGNRRSFIAFKQLPWHHFARSAVEKSQLTIRTPYLDNELVALAFQAPEAKQSNFDICLKLVAEGNSKLAGISTDRGVRYGASKVFNRLRGLKEQFLARAEHAFDYGMPNWLARVDSVLSPLGLERVFLGRQKFCHFRTWYRGRLAPYVKEILLDPRSLSRSYLHRREIERMVAHHVQGKGNFTTEIHQLLTLELTQRHLLERA